MPSPKLIVKNSVNKWIDNTKYLNEKEFLKRSADIHLLETILSLLSKAVIISISADIWSKPGMTASFLGVTAHFFTPDEN